MIIKYINLALFVLSFALFSIMTTDLIMSGNNWGIIQVLLYVAVALSAGGTGYAHITGLSHDK